MRLNSICPGTVAERLVSWAADIQRHWKTEKKTLGGCGVITTRFLTMLITFPLFKITDSDSPNLLISTRGSAADVQVRILHLIKTFLNLT